MENDFILLKWCPHFSWWHMACFSKPKKVHAWKGKFLIYVKAINIAGMLKHKKEKKNDKKKKYHIDLSGMITP